MTHPYIVYLILIACFFLLVMHHGVRLLIWRKSSLVSSTVLGRVLLFIAALAGLIWNTLPLFSTVGFEASLGSLGKQEVRHEYSVLLPPGVYSAALVCGPAAHPHGPEDAKEKAFTVKFSVGVGENAPIEEQVVEVPASRLPDDLPFSGEILSRSARNRINMTVEIWCEIDSAALPEIYFVLQSANDLRTKKHGYSIKEGRYDEWGAIVD